MTSVRRIRIGEGELFKRLRLTSLRESPDAFESNYQSALLRRPASWSERADSTAQGRDRSTFIAFDGDCPIGIAALYRKYETSDVGELLQMWVAPEYRGESVAIELLDTVFQWARENGFGTIVGTVREGNERALRFYRKYGFTPAAGDPPDFASHPMIIVKKIETL